MSDGHVDQLLMSMFPDAFQLVGLIPDGTDLADPLNDRLFQETQLHHWVQFDTGNGYQDFDATFADSQLGQRFTEVGRTFDDVPIELQQRITVRIDAETTNLATGLFGIPSQSTQTVLEESFAASAYQLSVRQHAPHRCLS